MRSAPAQAASRGRAGLPAGAAAAAPAAHAVSPQRQDAALAPLAQSCQAAAQLGQARLCPPSLRWGEPVGRPRSATTWTALAPLLIGEGAVAAAARRTGSVHAVCCALCCSACSQVAAQGASVRDERLAAQCCGCSTGGGLPVHKGSVSLSKSLLAKQRKTPAPLAQKDEASCCEEDNLL